MATVTPIRSREKEQCPRVGGGGRPPVIHFPQYGGGDGGRDDAPNPGERLKRYRFGLMIGMVSVAMLFVTFSGTFMVRHYMRRYDPALHDFVSDWQPVALPFKLLFLNTAVLLLSSLTVEKARRTAFQQAVIAPITRIPGIKQERWHIPWVGITLALGVCFLAGQAMAWRELSSRGYFLSSNPASSFVYLLTGLHAVHLAGGILALLYAAIAGLMAHGLERRRVVVDVAAWYWHFMGLLWLYVFAVLALG